MKCHLDLPLLSEKVTGGEKEERRNMRQKGLRKLNNLTERKKK